MSLLHRSIEQICILAGLIISLTLGQLTVVQAQQLEEIVVTAQRREQVTQDVPVSLEVIGGDDITRQGLETLKDLSIFAPGLIVQGVKVAVQVPAATLAAADLADRHSSDAAIIFSLERAGCSDVLQGIESLRAPRQA